MPKALRWTLIGVGSIPALVVLVLFLVWLYLQTGFGLRHAAELITGMLSDEQDRIEIGAIEHFGLWRVEVANVSASDPNGTWVEVDQATLDWNWSDIVDFSFRPESLQANTVRLARFPESEGDAADSDPIGLPLLPARHISIARVELEADVIGQPAIARIEGHEVETSDNTIDFAFELERLDGKRGGLTAQATYRRAEETLALVMELAEQADGLAGRLLEQPDLPAYQIRLAGEGPRTAWLGELGVLLDGKPVGEADVRLALGDLVTLGIDGTLRQAPIFGPDVNSLLGDAAPLSLDVTWDRADGLDIQQATFEGDGVALGIADMSVDLSAETLAGRITTNISQLSALPGMAESGLSGGGQIVLEIDSSFDQPAGDISLRLSSGGSGTVSAETITAQGRIESLLPLDDPKPEIRLWLEGRVEGLAGLPSTMEPAIDGAAEWSFDARYLVADSSVVFDAFDARTKHARVSGSGTIPQAPAEAHALARLSIDDLSILEPMVGSPIAGRLEAQADIVADLDTGAIRGIASAHAEAFSLADEALDSALGPTPDIASGIEVAPDGTARFTGLEAHGLFGTLTGDGTYASEDGRIDAKLRLDVPRLAVLSNLFGTPVAGSAVVESSFEGTTDALQAAGTLVANKLNAEGVAIDRLSASYGVADLLGLPRGKLKAKLKAIGVDAAIDTDFAVLENDDLKLSGLRVAAANAKAVGDLVIGIESSTVDGKAHAEISDLTGWAQLAGVDLGGAATIDATLGVVSGKQSVDFDLEGKNLALTLDDGTAYRINDLHAEARLNDVLGSAGGEAVLRLRNAEMPDMTLASFDLSGSGSRNDWKATASAAGTLDRPVEIELAATGSEQDDRLAFRLERLDGRYGKLPVKLTTPASFQLSPTAASVDRVELTAGTGKLILDGGFDGERVNAEASARGFPLELVRVFMPGFDFTGNAQLDARVAGIPANPTASATLEVIDLKPMVPDAPAGHLTVTGELAAGRLTATLNLGGLAEEPIEANFRMPMRLSLSPFALDVNEADRVQGQAKGQIDLALVAPLLPLDEDTLKGRMQMEGSLTGTLADPRLQGRAVLTNGYYENFMTAAALQDIRIEITATSDEIKIDPITATGVDGGRVEGGGYVKLDQPDRTPLQINVAFYDLWVARLDDASAKATGKISLEGALSELKLGGDIQVDQADIRIPDQLPASVVTIDVTEINKPGEPAEGPKAVEPPSGTAKADASAPMALDMTVNVPGRMFVRGRGLESEWAGTLTVAGTVDDPNFYGALNIVRGDFDLLGKRFNLVKGSITIDEDAPLEPEVDILAEASTTGITAQMRIEGRLKQPELTLSSQPELPPDEVLSRVLFEKGVGELSALEAVQLAQGAATLAGRGGTGGITDRLRRTVGFDTLSVGSSADGGASVTASKYLTDDVLLKVEQGTQPGSSRVGVEIEVTPNISVESSTNATGGTEVGANWKWDY